MTKTTYAKILRNYGFEFAGNLTLFIDMRRLMRESGEANELLGFRAVNILSYLREVARNVRKDSDKSRQNNP